MLKKFANITISLSVIAALGCITLVQLSSANQHIIESQQLIGNILFIVAVTLMLAGAVTGDYLKRKSMTAEERKVRDGNPFILVEENINKSRKRSYIEFAAFYVMTMIIYSVITFLGSKAGLQIGAESITCTVFFASYLIWNFRESVHFGLFIALGVIAPMELGFETFPWVTPAEGFIPASVEIAISVISLFVAAKALRLTNKAFD